MRKKTTLISRKIKPEFRHSGALHTYNGNLQWRESAGHEIRFQLPHDLNHWWALGDLNLSDEKEANIINELLAYYRPHAQPDAQNYYATSAVVTDSGQLFVAVNNERYIPEPFVGRGCAETEAHRCAQTALDTPNVMYRGVYLMSGQADKLPSGKLKDKESFHLACLCGECRRNLRHHTNQDTRFVMLPTNDGKMWIDFPSNSKEKSHSRSQAKPWIIDWNTMFPLPEEKALGTKYYKLMSREYAKGLEVISNPDEASVGHLELRHETKPAIISRRPTFELIELKESPTLDNINRTLVSLIRDAYQEHSAKLTNDKNLFATATVIQTKSGKYYPSVSVKGVDSKQVAKSEKDWLPSKPIPMATALSSAMNTDVEKAYIMQFNLREVRDELSRAQRHPAFITKRMKNKRFVLRYPDPAELGRLLKNTTNNESLEVTLLPFNSGNLEAETLDKLGLSFSAAEAFGPRFVNPKSTAHSI